MDSPSHRTLVDDAIDRVAADATNGAPRPDLRARVMARIDEPRSRFAPWMLVAATAAAIALVALGTIRPWHGNAPIESSPAVARTTPSTASPIVHEATTAAASTGAPTAAPTRTGTTQLAAVSVPSMALPPLEPVDPIVQESIQPTKLSIPQLTVEPIVMPAVDDGGSIRDRR